MALLSIENFMAPLKNMGQLITIVVIVFVFAVFRWQGGGVELRETAGNPSARTGDINADIDAYGNSEMNSPQYVAPRRHIIDEMMAEDEESAAGSASQRRAAQGAGSNSGSADSLDELERMVGLK